MTSEAHKGVCFRSLVCIGKQKAFLKPSRAHIWDYPSKWLVGVFLGSQNNRAATINLAHTHCSKCGCPAAVLLVECKPEAVVRSTILASIMPTD